MRRAHPALPVRYNGWATNKVSSMQSNTLAGLIAILESLLLLACSSAQGFAEQPAPVVGMLVRLAPRVVAGGDFAEHGAIQPSPTTLPKAAPPGVAMAVDQDEHATTATGFGDGCAATVAGRAGLLLRPAGSYVIPSPVGGDSVRSRRAV